MQQPPLFDWFSGSASRRRSTVQSHGTRPRRGKHERVFQRFCDAPASTLVVRLAALLLIGEAYREAHRKAAAEGVRRSYWKHIDKRRAAAREERRRNPEKWRDYMRAYNAQNRAKRTEYAKRHRAKHGARYEDQRLQRMYGITLAEYQQLLDAQAGSCAICGTQFGQSNRGSDRLHVDHDHRTGKPRGLLCGCCNRGIGQFGDDPQRVRAAARYLERFELDAPLAFPVAPLTEEEPS